MPHKPLHIAHTLTQGRQGNHQYRKPVEQIGTKQVAPDPLPQIGVGGRYNAHIHTDVACTADAQYPLRFKHAQQPPLCAQIELGHFVQKQRAVVGKLKQAGFALAACPGKSAFLIAKKL